MVELLHRPDQAEVSLLDEVRKGQTQVPVVLGDGDHELEVVLDEAVLDCAHVIMSVFHHLATLQQGLLVKSRLGLQGGEPARPAPALPHLVGDAEDPLPELGQQDEGELSVEQISADRGVDAPERSVRASLLQEGFAPSQAAPEPLYGTLYTGRDLTGLLVSGRLGELCTGVREGTQTVPARDHVARRAGHCVERPAESNRRGLEILGEDDLFLALQGPGSTDLLEVGLEGPAFLGRIDVLGGYHGCAAARSPRGLLASRCSVPFLELHHLPLGYPRIFRVKLRTPESDTVRGASVSNFVTGRADRSPCQSLMSPGSFQLLIRFQPI